ncbi:hypothetical protein OROMI_003729 [Orobanche minor]
MVREVAVSCVESLMAEIVSLYGKGVYSKKPELAAPRIEAIGFQVGHLLSERFTMDRPRFTDHLEAIKFICKDFWSDLFKKQIDNLKTNHRGTFVLQDNRFRWLAHMSVDPSVVTSGSIQDPSAMAENEAAQATGLHLYFPCGIIRGALSNLGIPCAVSADISNLPAYMDWSTSNVNIKKKRKPRRKKIMDDKRDEEPPTIEDMAMVRMFNEEPPITEDMKEMLDDLLVD